MARINLELWQKPNFPALDIFESRTKAALEAFNRCRILDIKLQTNDYKIKNFSHSFNSLTEKRAIESLRLSMYAGDVVVYMQLLSEENTSIGVILETLSSLLDAAQARQKATKELKNDYQEFLEKFNSEVANSVQMNLTRDKQIVIRNQKTTLDKKIWIIEIFNFTVPILCGSLFSYCIFKYPLLSKYKDYFFNYLLWYRQNGSDNKEEIQNSDSSSSDFTVEIESSKDNNENIEERNNEYHTSESPFDGLSMVGTSADKKRSFWSRFWSSSNKNTKLEDNNISSNPDNVDQSSQKGTFGSSASEDLLKNPPPSSNSNDNDTQDNIPVPPVSPTLDNLSSVITGSENGDIKLNNLLHISQYVAFGIFVGCLMWRLLRKTKPKQYRLWMKFFGKKDHKRKSRRKLDEQQLSIEKDNKILEIKEKLPVIVQNVEILDQFWDNQIINIKAHIESLRSVNENEKIIIPQQIAVPIKEDWNKQFKECKENYARMKDLVTHNSLLPIGVST